MKDYKTHKDESADKNEATQVYLQLQKILF